MCRAAVYKTEGASSNPTRANEFFVCVGSVRNDNKLVFEVSKMVLMYHHIRCISLGKSVPKRLTNENSKIVWSKKIQCKNKIL